MPCKSLPDLDLEAKMPQQTPYSFQFQKHLLPPEERNGIDNEIRLFHMVEMVRTMSWSDGEFQVRFMIGVSQATFITADDCDHDGAAEAAGMSVHHSRR
jgi:hypothetical protein